MLRRSRGAVGIVVALVTVIAWTAPATAAISHNRPGNAGWIANLPNTTTHVEGTIRAPSFSCDGHVLIQLVVLGRRPGAGHSRSDGAYFSAECTDGQPSESVVLVSQGTLSSSLTVAPHDELAIAIDTGTTEHLTVADTTSGRSVSLDSDLGLLAAKLKVIELDAALVGRTVFSGVSADATPLAMLPRVHGFDAPRSESPRLRVSKLDATGEGFTVALV